MFNVLQNVRFKTLSLVLAWRFAFAFHFYCRGGELGEGYNSDLVIVTLNYIHDNEPTHSWVAFILILPDTQLAMEYTDHV